MAKHQSYKDKLRETEFKKRILESLKAAQQQGLLQGSRAILHVIKDKITAKDNKTAEQKLNEILNFIDLSLEMTNKTVKEADAQAKEARKPIDELGQDAEAEVIEVPDETQEQDAKVDQEDGDK